MGKNLQTEKSLELDGEQLQAVTGGAVTSDTSLQKLLASSYLREVTSDMNTHLKNSAGMSKAYKNRSYNLAKVAQEEIRNNIGAGKTFEVSKGWADHLAK
jgi:hypothetical protein